MTLLVEGLPEELKEFAEVVAASTTSGATYSANAAAGFDDDIEQFHADREAERPQPPIECTVPTVRVAPTDLEQFQPLGPDTTKLEMRLRLNIARQLLLRGPYALVDLHSNPFPGDGVYALYYHGDFPLYADLKSPGATCPIYVGKSAQPGRASGNGQDRARNMHHRLTVEHLRSIQQVINLEPESFTFRFVMLPNSWVDFAEYSLFDLFQPAWNTIMRGFGSRNCDPDTRGRASTASPWDTLHPGRVGAGQLPRPKEDVEGAFLKGLPACLRAYQHTLLALGGT